MRPLNQSALQDASRTLAKVAETRVMAFDVFYFYDEPGEEQQCHAVSFSIGDERYVSDGGILDAFIEKHGTLSFNHESSFGGGRINPKSNGITISRKQEFRYREHTWDTSSFKQAEPKELVSFLETENFGNYYLLVRTRHAVSAIDVHFSSFVVFEDEILFDKRSTVISELMWLMLDNFSKMITDQLSTTAARHREEKFIERDQKKTALHIIGHIPAKTTMTSLKNHLKSGDIIKAQENWQTLRAQDLIRDLAINALYEFDPETTNLAWSKDLTKYSSLLLAILNTCPIKDEIDLRFSASNLESPVNLIASNDLIPALTLLTHIWFNLWDAHLSSA